MRSNDVRTKMKRAMVSLLKKKNYLQITVTDLVEEAGVARASFYRVYNSIDQVLNELFVDLKDILLKDFVPAFINKDEQKIRELVVDFLNQIKAKSFPTINVLPENRQYLIPKFESQFVQYKGVECKTMDEKYAIPLGLSLIYSISMIWSFCDFAEPAEEVADYVISKMHKL